MREAQPPASSGLTEEAPALAILDEEPRSTAASFQGALPPIGGVPQQQGPSASEMAYGDPLYDKQPGAYAGPETSVGDRKSFEKMTEGATKLGDAPTSVGLPQAAQDGLQHAWDASVKGGHKQEYGGNLTRDVHNGHMTSYGWRAGKPVKDDTFLPDPDDHGKDQRVVAVGHTHGYASGAEDVTFSGDDIAGMVDSTNNLDLLQSGTSRYMISRTAEFEARIKNFDEDQLSALRSDIEGTWTKAFAGKGTIQERSEQATVATCRRFQLAYYRGTGAKLDRIV
ncbi:hypothetical protein BH11MYX3_BH11MYX3_36920 [soil metagenome]